MKNPLTPRETPVLGIVILWFVALLLTLFELGNLPLRDFDEGIVARVAYELSNKKGIAQLLPTLWGTAYLNKPPGLHWIISALMQKQR